MRSPTVGLHRDLTASADRTGPPPGDPGRSSVAGVDAGEPSSLSFAAYDGSERGARSRSGPSESGPEGHARIGVGPGVPGALLLGGRTGLPAVNPFPIVGARIHPPLLRPDVLSRERLNSWLDQAASGRVALVIAEAGFGKTTFLADWARQSSRLTAWYRLEPDDRDWLTFARHLVASGRELDPAFAPETYALLMQLGPGGPSRDDILKSLAREVAAFGPAHPQGFTLIFDDYHAVDGSDEVVPTVRALLDLTGPGFSIVIASRSLPRLPLSRLRARGAVSRLNGEALCFEAAEADRLFRDAYHLPLDREVIDELVQRTEGWAALLSLVRTGLEERSDDGARELVRDLSSASGDLYDYLAEEVLGHLPQDLAEFLIRVSLLDSLDPTASAVLADVDVDRASTLLAAAEDLTLVVRPDPDVNHRFVPLVQDFLRTRLATLLSPDEVVAAHLRLAVQFEGIDWRISATHYRRAGDPRQARAVVGAALDEILATGQYRAADDLLAGEIGDEVVRDVLRSRLLLQLGATRDAIEISRRAVAAATSAAHAHLALAAQNAASIAVATRRYEDAVTYSRQATGAGAGTDEIGVSEAYEALLGASTDGNLPAVARTFESMLSSQMARGHFHYAAITSLNLAQILIWLDRSDDALRLASEAEHLLRKSSRGYEAVSVRLVQAQAKAYGGDWAAAEDLLRLALSTDHPEGEEEAVREAASLAAWFGPYEYPHQILARVDRNCLPTPWALHWLALDLWLEERPSVAQQLLEATSGQPPASAEAGAGFRWHVARARASLMLGHVNAFREALVQVDLLADAQGSPVQRRIAALLRALGEGVESVSAILGGWPSESDPLLGIFAREMVEPLASYSDGTFAVIDRAAGRCRHRWRPYVRNLLVTDQPGAGRAATLLEHIGEWSDVRLLRDFTRRAKRPGQSWGDALARQTAPRLMLDDLGPTFLGVGDRIVNGRNLRRKVLGLFLFLASQPNGSATPDQVLEAMWPELDPEQGINSVHQTVYFLRRVIDPDYRAGVSVDYLHFNSDMIWLDRTLVDCRSWLCRRLIARRPQTPAVVDQLLDNYLGRFAPDFAYEDWSAAYRDGLHAAFLAVVERAVAGQIGSADARWRLWVGQRTLTIDPDADAIEAQVIRLYRILGATAAAAEQYAHYATVMRDQLGIEPPQLSEM